MIAGMIQIFAKISTASQAAEHAQTILNAASAHMLRVSYGVTYGVM
jgi:hypothetical protein